MNKKIDIYIYLQEKKLTLSRYTDRQIFKQKDIPRQLDS